MKSKILLGAVVSVVAIAACGSDNSVTVQSTTYATTLTGAKERPNPNASTATGTATFLMVGSTLNYTVNVTGLSANITGSHIHVGSADVSGGIVSDLTQSGTQTGIVISGSINLAAPIVRGTSTITGDSLKVLLNNGNAYVNIHTSTYPGGEIRGNLTKL